ncbi:MAG TPA: hypothetical protein VJ850_09560 [Candidatus Limnocylindrales bacterium]|nr:hypothetical protein [Candidatus Limnocylindrales bacterium]
MAALRRAVRLIGSLALAGVVGSGLAAAGALHDARNAGAAAGAVPGVLAAGAPTAGPGEGAVAGRVAVSAVTVRLAISTKGSRGKPITEATVTVTNLMRSKLGTAVVSLRVDAPDVVIKPAGTRTLRGIAAGRAATAAWTLCSRVARDVTVVAEASVNGMTTMSAPIRIRLPASARC